MPLLMFQHVQAARWDAIANAAVRSGCGATCQQGKFDPKKTALNDQPWKRRVEKCMLYHVTSNSRANRACHNLRETSSQVCLSGEFSDDENSNPTIKVHQISSVTLPARGQHFHSGYANFLPIMVNLLANQTWQSATTTNFLFRFSPHKKNADWLFPTCLVRPIPT
jgi:hypothetical protein